MPPDLMIPLMIGAVSGMAGGLTNMGTSIANTVASQKQADLQNQLNQDILSFNKDMAYNSATIRSRDYAKAGMSATLGLNAQPVTLTPPQVARTEYQDIGNGLFQVGNAMQLATQIKQAEATIDNLNASANAQNANAEKARIEALKTVEDTKGVKIDNKYRDEKQRLANELTGSAIEKNRADTQYTYTRDWNYQAEHIAKNPLSAVWQFGKEAGYALDSAFKSLFKRR